MNTDDQTLIAYLDGELDSQQREALEAALQHDPALQARLAALQDSDERIKAHFDAVLEEPVPAHLLALLEDEAAGTSSGAVTGQGASSTGASWSEQLMELLGFNGWRGWGAVTAALLAGVLIGQMPRQAADDAIWLVGADGYYAAAELASALETQASGVSESSIQVTMSYREDGGGYCRSFVWSAVAQPLAGAACRTDAGWRMQVLSPLAPEQAADYRLAGSALPPAVRSQIEAQIDGAPLSAEQEQLLMQREWR